MCRNTDACACIHTRVPLHHFLSPACFVTRRDSVFTALPIPPNQWHLRDLNRWPWESDKAEVPFLLSTLTHRRTSAHALLRRCVSHQACPSPSSILAVLLASPGLTPWFLHRMSASPQGLQRAWQLQGTVVRGQPCCLCSLPKPLISSATLHRPPVLSEDITFIFRISPIAQIFFRTD